MSKLPARYQTMNSERKSFKSFITEEREAFKVEFQICQLLFEWKSLLIATYFWTYFWWNILELLFWLIGICSLCNVQSESVKNIFLKVCASWRQFAVRLGLESCIPTINGFRETNKLKILFDVWKEERLETYNVKNLKAILSQEVVNTVTIKSFLWVS